MQKALFLIGLLGVCTAHAQVTAYDFTLYPAGYSNSPAELGSFEYQQGAITDAIFNGTSFAGKLTDGTPMAGNTILTFTNVQGVSLTGNLVNPLHGQTDVALGFVEAIPASPGSAAGTIGFCGGSGLCNMPIFLTSLTAPELHASAAAEALFLLVTMFAIWGGGRRLRKVPSFKSPVS
ncbi:MAG TPA: hypothetical protein VGL87_13000 [Steroidobacteraceae bacterium]